MKNFNDIVNNLKNEVYESIKQEKKIKVSEKGGVIYIENLKKEDNTPKTFPTDDESKEVLQEIKDIKQEIKALKKENEILGKELTKTKKSLLAQKGKF